jgi:mRNA interferase HicA
VKRRELERHLRDHGVELLREGGKHSFWGFDRERSTTVPRHREIKPETVRAICRDLGIPPRRVSADRTASGGNPLVERVS